MSKVTFFIQDPNKGLQSISDAEAVKNLTTEELIKLADRARDSDQK